ncbi:MAG: hypothetical protein LBM09_02865 [Candidatus Nomurabacteria bacterium]|jgi:hypothetical protein|nr:hypothetical protein [Candidatus Nomurabacteria bacterium]
MTDAKLTFEQKSLSRRFLVYKFVKDLWFIGAIWLFFYRFFMTDTEIGSLDAIAFAIGLLVEIPSGRSPINLGGRELLKSVFSLAELV